MARWIYRIAILAGILTGSAAAHPAPVIAPRLEQALATPTNPWRSADGSYALWVTFADKGVASGAMPRALAVAEVALSPRARQRREKMARSGAALVTATDLPLSATYVAQVLATGARERQRSRWLDALSVDASPAQIARIANLACVTRIDLVARTRRPAPPPVTPADLAALREANARLRAKSATEWTLDYGSSLAGLMQIDVPFVHELGFDGSGVVVGMLDTGFRTTHDALAHLPIIATHDFINGDDDVNDEPGDPNGQFDHGTKTCSTLMGFAPGHVVGPAYGASVILAKTEDTSQEVPIEEDYWVAGLEWLESLGADVVSSSLGYSDWYTFADLDGNTAVTTIAADIAVSLGVCVVNSAGNERGGGHFGHIIAPADGDSVVTVGAVDLNGNVAGFSSPGPTYDGRIKPDVAALGLSVPCAASTNDSTYTSASGTSLSCPLAAGVTALVLARAPFLTPIQVRDALRETSSHPTTPDNDTGWGILDAYAAVTYWGPNIAHEPLIDTEDTIGPYAVVATVTDRLPLAPAQAALHWRGNGGAWQTAAFAAQGGDTWSGLIPGQTAGTTVDYYLEVTDASGLTMRAPADAPGHLHTFVVDVDTVPPTLLHQPLGDQPLTTWPPQVVALADDNLGIDRVELTWTIDGGATQGPDTLAVQSGGAYTLEFPVAVADLHAGAAVTYTLTAYDVALVPNSTVSGPHAFTVVDAPGVVGVIDDAGGPIATWLADAGYQVTTLAPADVTAEALTPYQVVVYTAGGTATSLEALPGLRASLIARAEDGGKLLVEGGEVARLAHGSSGFPTFAQEVLHTTGSHSDFGGALVAAAGASEHRLLNYPHVIPLPLALDYQDTYDQDTANPAADAELILVPSGFPSSAGLLIHDDDAAPQSAQTVFLACNAGALDPQAGRDLVENALAFLLAVQVPATATISGHVALADGAPPVGVTVSCAGQSVITVADGAFTLGPFDAGTYTVTARKYGYRDEHRDVAVAVAEQVTGVDLSLVPVTVVHAAVQPERPIPDGQPGIVSAITVTDSGICTGLTVDVDITHPAIGDLRVVLFSPVGTSVVLHDNTGGDADNLVGTWPTTLSVDGPGSLDDALDEEIQGNWLLFVTDNAGGNVGTLHSWGLNLQVPVADIAGGVPAATHVVAVAPNPFNPQTVVTYDLARAGHAQLSVYDVRGRHVRTLVDASLPAGRHTAPWDGRDASGRAMASGTYVCRLEAEDTVTQQKMTLVR